MDGVDKDLMTPGIDESRTGDPRSQRVISEGSDTA
jgi:hypothetical protein